MNDEIIINETIGNINTLYKSIETISEFINDYRDRYDISNSESLRILDDFRNNSYEYFLKQLISNDVEKINDFIMNMQNKLEKFCIVALSEIAHEKSKNIEFSINNPLFFTKLRKNYRDLKNELNNLDDSVVKDKNDIEKYILKFENVIERLRTLEYEIEEDKRSGLYNFIAKSAVWGIPILIGVYQLIAMQFFNLNPYIPLASYFIILLLIYLLLKSISDLKFLILSLKHDKFLLLITGIPFTMSIFLLIFLNIFTKNYQLILFALFPLLMSILLIMIGGKEGIQRYKNKLILNEFMDLTKKYEIENMSIF